MDTSSNKITEVTRRALMDYLCLGRSWSGSLQEHDFLARLYDLNRMPSTDYRPEYDTGAKDIWKHRVMNSDWLDDWVFTDPRFDLLHGSDESLLRFLAETVHPVARPDTEEAQRMVTEFNSLLRLDGWELFHAKEVSGKPVFAYRKLSDAGQLHLAQAKEVADKLSGPYIAQQVRRLGEACNRDYDLAIGTAKEFLETLCKTILLERRVTFSRSAEFPALVRTTLENLPLVPSGVSEPAQARNTVKGLLSSLASIVHQMAELRNQFGTGHGKPTQHIGLQRHHANLAVGVATTLAFFLYGCHEVNPPKP